MLHDGSLSYISGHKTAMGASNNYDRGCIPKRLEKEEQRCKILVVAEAIY